MLFGAQFLRFMQGFKHKGHVTLGMSEKGYYDPAETSVKFTVPNKQVLADFSPISALQTCTGSVFQGSIKPIIDMNNSDLNRTSHVLTFDGKKIVPNTADFPVTTYPMRTPGV